MSTRHPITAGLFYPQDPEACRRDTEAILRTGDPPDPPGAPRNRSPGSTPAVLFPHAAWDFIGPMAASGFQELSPDRRDPEGIRHILVAAPVHRESRDLIFLPRDTEFSTPLGTLPVELPPALQGTPPPPYQVNGIPHDEEHGIEVILPLLRFLYPRAALIPLLLGSPRPRMLREGAHILTPWYREKCRETLLVGTGNLSGFIPAGQAGDTPPMDGCFQGPAAFLDALLKEAYPGAVRRLTASAPSPEDPYQHKTVWYGTLIWEENP